MTLLLLRSPIHPLDSSLNTNSLLKKKSYLNQYSNIYFNRLNQIRPNLIIKANHKWNHKQPTFAKRTLDIVPNTLVWFIGTVYRSMPLKQNILDDLALEYANKVPPPLPEKYFTQIHSESNPIIAIEDEFGRVDVHISNDHNNSLVTGIVIAVLGSIHRMQDPAASMHTMDSFSVVDVCYPGLLVQDSIPRPILLDHQQDCWVALVSGLNIGGQDSNALSRLLLAQLLVGNLNQLSTLNPFIISKISHLFILGNSLVNDYTDLDMQHFDAILQLLLSSYLPVTILPGPSDPTTHLLPQQPIHQSLFQSSNLVNNRSGFESVTNPLFAKIDDYPIVLTSGQNLDDVYKYVHHTDRLKMACQFLEWRHIAPTAPDTLWCYPIRESDPFVLHCRPRLFAIGNQPEFQTCLYNDPDASDSDLPVRVMLVPEFSKSGSLVLVNLKSLEYHVVQLNIDDSSLHQ